MVLSVSFQSYFRYSIFDSLSLFHYFLFLLWPRSEHFRSAVLCRAHKIKMYFVRHNYVKWKYVYVCVGFSNQIYKHFSRKVFWCKCKSCNWQTIAPLFRLNSIWVCWLHWLLKCNFHRFYHSGKFDGKNWYRCQHQWHIGGFTLMLFTCEFHRFFGQTFRYSFSKFENDGNCLQ